MTELTVFDVVFIVLIVLCIIALIIFICKSIYDYGYFQGEMETLKYLSDLIETRRVC